MRNDKHDVHSIRQALRSFLSQPVLPLAKIADFSDEDSFLERGILDSTGILELVGFIEEHFSIQIDTEELTPDNLDSINNLVVYIEKKIARLVA